MTLYRSIYATLLILIKSIYTNVNLNQNTFQEPSLTVILVVSIRTILIKQK